MIYIYKPIIKNKIKFLIIQQNFNYDSLFSITNNYLMYSIYEFHLFILKNVNYGIYFKIINDFFLILFRYRQNVLL